MGQVAVTNWTRASKTNIALSANYPALVPTATKPSGNGVVPLGAVNVAEIAFYGVGANDNSFQCQIVGWRPLVVSGVSTIWTPVPIMQATAQLSSALPGVANTAIPATNLFADVLTIDTDFTPAAGSKSGALNGVPVIRVPIPNCQLLQLVFKNAGTPATSANALLALSNQ